MDILCQLMIKQLLSSICFSPHTCVVFIVVVKSEKTASKVMLVPFGFERVTLEFRAQSFSLSLL